MRGSYKVETMFEKIYHQYHEDIYQYIFYMVKDKQETEDIIQEVYIRVLRSYHSFNHESSEKTWIFSIARHVTYDYFRTLKRKRNRIVEFFNWSEKGNHIQATNKTPEEVVVQSDEIIQMYHCLDTCTANQREVIILRYLQQLSIKETADILGWTESNVKTTQHRALKALEKCMQLQDEGRSGHNEKTNE